MENSKSSEEEDAAAEAEEKQAMTTETNKSEQTKEENNTHEEEKVEDEKVSSIVNSRDPSATPSADNINQMRPPSDQPSAPHVALPSKDVKEEEEKGDDTTQQVKQHSAAQKVVKSENAVDTVAAQPNIGTEDAIAKCTTPTEPLEPAQNSGYDTDGEEKKMDDDDLYVAQPRSPPKTTPGIKTGGISTAAKVVPSPLGASSVSTPQSDTTKAKSMPTPSSTTCSSSRGNGGRSLEELMTTDDMANATMEQKVDGVSRICAYILPFLFVYNILVRSSWIHSVAHTPRHPLLFHFTAQTPSQHPQESIRSGPEH